MRLAAYPFPEGLRSIERYAGTGTSDLLAQGLAVGMAYAGVPVYAPIGERVISRIERHLTTSFEAIGFDPIRIPSIIKTSDLLGGEIIGEKFAKKLIHLERPSSEFHLLSTPEMMLVRTIGPRFSHAQLPIRVCYTADFFRDADDLKPLLVGRQFRIFGAFGFEPEEHSATQAISSIKHTLLSVLADFSIPSRLLELKEKGFEVFFPTSEGDYRADRLDEVASPADQRLLSLGMAYQYGKGVHIPARMRTHENRNAPMCFMTFGLCTNRLLFAAYEAGRTPEGFRLPALLRPFSMAVIPRTPDQEATAVDITRRLENVGIEVALDDRYKLPCARRRSFAKLLGIPTRVSIENGTLLLCSDTAPNGVRPVTITELLETPHSGARS